MNWALQLLAYFTIDWAGQVNAMGFNSTVVELLYGHEKHCA